MTEVYFPERKFLLWLMELLVYLKLWKMLFQNFSLLRDLGEAEALRGLLPQALRDRPHLKEHLYAGVEAMELPQKIKMSINDALISLIDVGKVRKVIKKLQNYQGVGAKKIETLANYLIRFRSLCSL